MLSASIRSYSEASGSLVNLEKSQALWTLDTDPSYDLLQFAKASTHIKILGVNFGNMDSNSSSLWVNSIRYWILPFAESWVRGGSLKRRRWTGDHLPQYLDYGLKCVRRWGLEKSYIESSTRRDLYAHVCRTFFYSPLALRDCVTTTLQESLRFLNWKRLPPKLFDVTWLSLHSWLFVRGNLKHLSLSDRNCPLVCQQEETMEHFICDCWGGRKIWEEVSANLKIPRLRTLKYPDIIYGVPSTVSNIDRETMYIIISVIKYYHWHMRTRVSLHNELFDHTTTAGQEYNYYQGFKLEEANLHIPGAFCEKRSLPKLEDCWVQPGPAAWKASPNQGFKLEEANLHIPGAFWEKRSLPKLKDRWVQPGPAAWKASPNQGFKLEEANLHIPGAFWEKRSLPKLEDRWVQPGPAAWKASPNQGFKLEEANLHIPGAFWEKRSLPKLEDRWVQPGPAAWKASPNQGFKLEEANLHIPGAFWEKRSLPKLEDRWVQPGPAAWKASPNQGFKLEEANLHIPGAFWEKRSLPKLEDRCVQPGPAAWKASPNPRAIRICL
ncbi:unnamed protein product [Ranitomeya imitator]|uniref:Reverse transcriptase zinc-binding domain-containing protein n=1 Tax=Ranitomeya imitator TaxID=111125 RepID=A0ABN9M414_9NEOB|nr:unnamed protein product [Ranitomeya imitator]